jgi:Zn-dependent M16 (insulinase) family peptidase
MLNRTMATFMNAMTAHDYTMYPYSTQNSKDFDHLMSVYMDSVFDPLLTRLDFKQEGWRLEFNPENTKEKELILKGVVYNEMKGALSDVNSLFYTRFQQELFPNTSYQYVSGGDPPFITDLTHQALKDFHASNYHPSRSMIYLYGDFPLDQQLTRLHEKLSLYDSKPLPSKSTPIDVFDFQKKSRKVLVHGPPDPIQTPLKKQTRYSITFETCTHSDLMECLYLKVATSLLIDGPGSPMYKALIDSRLGSDYSVNTGLDDSTKITTVSFGLQGVDSSNVETVKQTIFNTLEKVVKEGMI